MTTNLTSDIIKAVILGHAVGDALGVPVEFASRAELDANPVTEMEGFGTYPVPAGAWSDDTSMSLCAFDVLASGKLDYDRIMVNFGKWYYKGEFTPTGKMFDAGNTCSIAIDNYFNGRKDTDHCGLTGTNSNGNGSLMRINPFVIYSKFICNGNWADVIRKASALTHAHERSTMGCLIYACILRELLNEPSRKSVISGIEMAESHLSGNSEAEHYKRLFSHGFPDTDRSGIRSSGYVVDTLEAAVWCLLNSESYEECVLKAVNLGDDTDTVAAVAGGLAGALYGLDAIPKKWLDSLLRRDYIEEMCERAAENWQCD